MRWTAGKNTLGKFAEEAGVAPDGENFMNTYIVPVARRLAPSLAWTFPSVGGRRFQLEFAIPFQASG